jgi:hypothetical protein
MHYETWLFRFLGSEIYFKGHFGHEGGPKEQDSNKNEPIKSRTKNLQTKHQNKSQ